MCISGVHMVYVRIYINRFDYYYYYYYYYYYILLLYFRRSADMSDLMFSSELTMRQKWSKLAFKSRSPGKTQFWVDIYDPDLVRFDHFWVDFDPIFGVDF